MASQQTPLDRERARVRDLLRYYNPNAKGHHRPPPGSENITTLIFCDVGESSDTSTITAFANEASDGVPDDSKLLLHDPTLTAFAQLGAFRLNCQRGFISLMDQNNQYLLAEATRSVSLNDQSKSDQGDEIYLGARVLDLVWGVCPNTIQIFTAKDDSLNVSTSNINASRECYVMNDMSITEKFKDRPYIAGWPHMRFYAEVPIQSPSGHVLGTFCVVDDKPRDGLTRQGLETLNEISSAIMNHLELVQMQHNLQRAGKMVKGLGLFVEGKGSVQIEAGEQNDHEKHSERTPSRQTETSRARSSTSRVESSIQDATQPTSVPAPSIQESVGLDKVKNGPEMVAPEGVAGSSRERSTSVNNGQIVSEGNRQLFSRASFLIREALELDGIIFVDACFRDIAIDPANPILLYPRESQAFRGIPDTLANDRSEWLDGSVSNAFTNDEFAPDGLSSIQGSLSYVLGYSSKIPSDAGGLSSATQLPLPQSALRRLLRKYPQGHTFVFDEDGQVLQFVDDISLSETEDSEYEQADGDNELDNKFVGQLSSLCPGAKSIIFFPLWDPQRNQWFAGSLAWTKDPTRIIQSADITYMAAFASCIMSEKSRLDVLTADRAKGDFISSVSHELRSPLHGILASAEALQDGSTSSAQEDMIQTIMGCGEILLDTMDQILDYAKTSHSEPMSPPKRHKESKIGRISTLELVNLVETITEAIIVGHDYQRSKSGLLDNADRGTSSTSSVDKVIIILSVDSRTPGILKSQVSSWKRILMNLCGNAFKYTHSGFVHISLRTQIAPADSTSPARRYITVQIDDSGKGISKEYLKYNLFTPFAQEDQHSPGTGLGLSIVRELVANLSGEVDVQSEVGYGTTVKVSIPVNDHLDKSSSGSVKSNSIITDTRVRCKGLKLCFVDFGYYPDIGGAPTGVLSAYARRILALKSAITKIASDWFEMEVVTASSVDDAKGDMLVGLRSKWNLLGEDMPGPLIIFEDADEIDCWDTEGIFSLPQFVGPQTLARILAQCMDYRVSVAESSHAEISTMSQASAVPQDIISQHNIDQDALDILKIPIVKTNQGESVLPQNIFLKDLPLRRREVSSVEDVHNPSMVPRKLSARNKVLLVEDNIINMKILVNYMKRAKQDYVTAANGLEALQIYQSSSLSFKAIFMDISMPIMDGLTSTRRIRKHEEENSIPRTRIVALTCFSTLEYKHEAAVSGCDLFLVKPVLMKSLKPILDQGPEGFGGDARGFEEASH